MTDWKAVAGAIAPDIPMEQLERIAPLLEGMRGAFLEHTRRIDLTTEPSYIQSVAEMEP